MHQRTEEGADPNAAWTAILGLTGAFLTAAIVLGLESLFYHVNAVEREKKIVNVASEELLQMRATQLQNVTTYRFVDSAQGVVSIPVDQAMELVRDELRGTSRPPQTELAPVTPAHAPQGAPATHTPETGGAHTGH